MKKFKTIMFLFLISASALMADYEIFVTKTAEVNGQEKEIFFGTLADYSKARVEANKMLANGVVGAAEGASQGAAALAANSLGEGAKYVGSGAALGVLVSFLDPYVMDFYADQQYILIRKIGDTGELKAVFFVGDKHPSLSEEEIHKILKNK